MDLFNPPPIYNLTKMDKKINIKNLENPYVQVVWEDYSENFTQERIKSVRHYFQKKYDTKSVNVITKTKLDKDDITSNVDISHNLIDSNFQITLIDDFLSKKGLDEYKEEVLNFNTIVDNQLLASDEESTPFKKWYIKNIEFSNFLSYGKNQKIDFEKCEGIIAVESDPPNFGGKSILTVDLLLFLFFNETTKSSKAIDIFNRFTNDNKVIVKGEIIIDGDEYIIVRNIERKLSKKNEWNVKTELDFYKKLSDGSLQNFTGEQRRETESFIKKSIGTKDDFLMTILTTSSNLEGLIDAKPTARGQVVSRFMGLDYLKRKEEIAKGFYSDFSKSMISNIYNSEELKNDNQDYKETINSKNEEINQFNDEMVTVQERIIKGQQYRDSLIKQKFNDIDDDISRLVPSKLKEKIKELENEQITLKKQIKGVEVVEPSEYYYEDKHDLIKSEYRKEYEKSVEVRNKIKDIEELKTSVGDGIKCEHCGIELINAEITKNKISKLDGFLTQKEVIEGLMRDLTSKENEFVKLKKEFDQYEKNKLIREKYIISLESVELKINNLKDKLKKYFEIQDKIKKNNEVDSKMIQADLLMEKLEREKTELTNKISNHKFEIKTIEGKIKNNIKTIKNILDESKKEKIYKIYLELFGKNGISKMIMKTMMPLINSELQRLLEDTSHFRLEVRINEKNEVEFIMIDNNSQVEKSMSSGSGFERTVASLALRSVLSKICSLPKPNITVFDEVFGKISNENLEMVGEFFIKIKDYFEKIFVITHNPLVNNWSDSVVRIKKVENISQVEQ